MCTTVNKAFYQCSLSLYIQSPDSFCIVQVVQVAVKNMLVLRWNQRHIVSFVADPKGTVPFGKARTLVTTVASSCPVAYWLCNWKKRVQNPWNQVSSTVILGSSPSSPFCQTSSLLLPLPFSFLTSHSSSITSFSPSSHFLTCTCPSLLALHLFGPIFSLSPSVQVSFSPLNSSLTPHFCPLHSL